MPSAMSINIDVLVLNRNLKAVTDTLVSHMANQKNVSGCFVIDSGSREEEKSEHTVVGDNSHAAYVHGLRPNRGFNLGVSWWLENRDAADYLLLLPNDSELVKWDIERLIAEIGDYAGFGAVIPLPPNDPYLGLLGGERVGIGWNFHEGPILFTRNFLEARSAVGPVFDPENFRGYLSFIDMACQMYSSNVGILATDLIQFSENTSILINEFQLMGTEPLEENLALLVSEGENWLAKKYGTKERWTIELIARLLFEEFLLVNPDLKFKPLL